MSKYTLAGIGLYVSVILCTCDRAPDDVPPQERPTVAVEAPHEDEHAEEGIHLSPEQIEAMGIGFGALDRRKVNDYIGATGTLGLPPNGYTGVNAPAAGYIRNSNKYVEGDYVRRGAMLATLENPDFIERQRSYLGAVAELTFLQQELARQEVLLAADAGILKEVQRRRSEMAAKLADVSALRQHLTYLGIDTEGLTPAGITQQVQLLAPRSGYITSIALHDGMYARPETELMEIIDEDHLHLELDVFEGDIARVERGQRVTYQIPSLGQQRYAAEVHVIGKEFNDENKTVRVHAHLRGEQPPFIQNLFAEARIWLDDQTVEALPEEAIFRDGKMSYVFTAPATLEGPEVEFERLRVRPGATEDGYTAVQLIDPLPPGRRIVTEGGYYVYAQSQAGALEDPH
jgi:cobalt-zinc-cadmium efflux system membrane fusion protein